MTLGIFDSGLGGLTVVKEIKKLHPTANIIYLGDTARVPYGTRSKEIIEKFAIEDAKFLENRGVDKIIIACNTVSALAYDAVCNAVNVPVIEIISTAVQAAKKASKTGKIGVIGTRATINSGAYNYLGLACPLLVPLIEEGEISGELIKLALYKYLQEVKTWNVDTLILGCTHYPIISKLIDIFFDGHITLINPGLELAKSLIIDVGVGKREYFVTDLTTRFVNTAEMFLGENIGAKIRLTKL